MKIPTIYSGGQTGADRAALSWAISRGIPHGGWCPRGRRAEDGTIPAIYQLRETSSKRYRQRTEWNVRDSDATIIFTSDDRLMWGCKLTADFARRHQKPWLHLPPCEDEVERLRRFLEEHQPRILNVAGQRASTAPELAERVRRVLDAVFMIRKKKWPQ